MNIFFPNTLVVLICNAVLEPTFLLQVKVDVPLLLSVMEQHGSMPSVPGSAEGSPLIT